MSLRQLSDLLRAGLGVDYIKINGDYRQISKMTIKRMQAMPEIEIEFAAARILEKILS